jgi:hypothetical protein
VRELSCPDVAVDATTGLHEQPLPSSRVRLPPALVYRWSTAVYRSLVGPSDTEVAALNSVLAAHILSLRARDRAHRGGGSTVKSNRGGWHSTDLQLLGRPELDAEALRTEGEDDKMLRALGSFIFFIFLSRECSFERFEDLNVESARRQQQGQQRMACRATPQGISARQRAQQQTARRRRLRAINAQ